MSTGMFYDEGLVYIYYKVEYIHPDRATQENAEQKIYIFLFLAADLLLEAWRTIRGKTERNTEHSLVSFVFMFLPSPQRYQVSLLSFRMAHG